MDAPEAFQDPWVTSLEVSSSTAPEHDYEPQDFPPEIAPIQGLEAINHVSLDSANHGAVYKGFKRKIRWKWMMTVTFVIMAVGIGGGAGGSIAYKRRFVNPVCDTYRTKYLTLLFIASVQQQTAQANTTSSSSSAPSPSLSGIPYNASADQFKMSHTILFNTSIAATHCMPNDRWVFLQDVTGTIRGAQFSVSTSSWNTTLQAFNFTPAMMGTALSASCVYLTDTYGLSGSLSLGPYVSNPGYFSPQIEASDLICT